MRDELRRLISVILEGIVLDEGFARELAEIAHQCQQDGNPSVARGMQALSRMHRVKGIEGRAKLAGLCAQYAHILDESA
ncbi:hypothetical protein [Methylobacterium sp. WSM2598]|uniref:hypothetical protein n=1 Tax=Methylobacterium sp. WSM2598 TaxID=398261 RepID=UPI000363879B|nr:hypothetical protein [Methylobacterium sp. WSM2598]